MPATVIEASLGISCVFSDDRTAELHLDGLSCRELVRDLLFGLVELIQPHGSIDSAHSVDKRVTSDPTTRRSPCRSRVHRRRSGIAKRPADRVLDGDPGLPMGELHAAHAPRIRHRHRSSRSWGRPMRQYIGSRATVTRIGLARAWNVVGDYAYSHLFGPNSQIRSNQRDTTAAAGAPPRSQGVAYLTLRRSSASQAPVETHWHRVHLADRHRRASAARVGG
jgi:hypothetical protein